MKKQWKPWLYVAAVLCMSCEKKNPDACGPSEGKYRYVRTIKNARADLGQNAFFAIEGGDGALICPSQEEMFSTYENTYVNNQPQQPYKYRIWGRIFNCDACPTIVAGPSPAIVIDKIEKIN
jgi:hypothetical protein